MWLFVRASRLIQASQRPSASEQCSSLRELELELEVQGWTVDVVGIIKTVSEGAIKDCAFPS